jgi:hypothetical protein
VELGIEFMKKTDKKSNRSYLPTNKRLELVDQIIDPSLSSQNVKVDLSGLSVLDDNKILLPGEEKASFGGLFSDENPPPKLMRGTDVPENTTCIGIYADCFEVNSDYLRKPAIMGDTCSPLPALPEDIDILRNQIQFDRVDESIFAYIIAIDRNSIENNTIQSLKACGDPLGGYAYTPENDTYIVNCHCYGMLGIIPMVFRMTIPGYAGKQLIPLPEFLIFKHSSNVQRKAINDFKERFIGFEIQFIQSLCRS